MLRELNLVDKSTGSRLEFVDAREPSQGIHKPFLFPLWDPLGSLTHGSWSVTDGEFV